MHEVVFLVISLLLVLGLLIPGIFNYHIEALNQTNPFGINDSLTKENLSQTSFTVNKTYPTVNQMNVKLNKKISVAFSDTLNSSSLTNGDKLHNLLVIKGGLQGNISNISSIDQGYVVPGKYSLIKNNKTLVFKPHSAFVPNTVYSVILFGKDHCNILSNVSSNGTLPSPSFAFPFLSNSTSNNSSNKTGYICGLKDIGDNFLDRNYIWSFTTSLSPPVISEPKINSSMNKKIITISGTDPNYSDQIKLFRLDSNDKLKQVGSAIPNENGYWSTKLELGKLNDGIYRFVAKAFENTHNRTSEESDKLALVIDTQPPIIEVPSDITVQSAGSLTITFESNATDNLDGMLKISCSPLSSGEIFPIGLTKVTCKAKDGANNEGSASFNVNISSMNALALSCTPDKVAVVKGKDGSIECLVENKTLSPLELNLSCSQLDKAGIECYVNGKLKSTTIILKEKSSDHFHILVSSKSSLVLPGLYPFTISAKCKDDSC